VAPITNPVTPEVGSAGVVTVAAPATTVHVPVPEVGVFPAKVDVITLHKIWSGPAAAEDGVEATVMFTSSVDAGQDALEIVHLSVTDEPAESPVTVDVGDAGVVMVQEPETIDQVPVPVVGVLPANIVLVTLHKLWSGPASATVGAASTVTTTSSEVEPQLPLEIVHLKVVEAPIVRPLTVDVGSAGTSALPVPAIVDHAPVPTVGVFPAKVVVVILHNT